MRHGKSMRGMAGARLLRNTDSARQLPAGSEGEFTREVLMEKNNPKPQLLKTCPSTMKPHSSAHGAGSGWEKKKEEKLQVVKGKKRRFPPIRY